MIKPQKCFETQFNVLNKTNSFFKVGNPIINFKVSCAIIVPTHSGNSNPVKLQLGTSLELGGSGNKSRKFFLGD
jgi:hypothetical protein